jgi:GTP-binding protein HflX
MERVVLVGTLLKKRAASKQDAAFDEYSLEELRRLTETAGGTVAETVTQRLIKYHPGTLIGAGKIAEVKSIAQGHAAKTVVFDDNLSPAQQIHLEKALGAKVVDRTRLILDIFAQRARTKEGELQVELAQLSYSLPRLTGSWRGFSQQVGGIGTRGPGERKIEYERRHVQLRIKHLKKEIDRLKRTRALQRRRRSEVPVPTVAIIGYTNAGKSTLLNHLTKRTPKVYADDKLFATLDPTARRVALPEGGWAVLTDTVGFISKLPTSLIAAFRSTLEETAQADCLLHLEDGGSPFIEQQRGVVDGVLNEFGATDIPRVSAVNKTDLLGAGERARLAQDNPNRVFVSALAGQGLQEVLRRVQDVLNERWLLREFTLEHAQAARLSDIYAAAQVLGQEPLEDGRLRVRVRVTQENWSRLVHRLSLN